MHTPVARAVRKEAAASTVGNLDRCGVAQNVNVAASQNESVHSGVRRQRLLQGERLQIDIRDQGIVPYRGIQPIQAYREGQRRFGQVNHGVGIR